MHFLIINLISCRRPRGIVLVMTFPAREMDNAGKQWNTEQDVRNVKNFSIERLPSGRTRSCMPQQSEYAGVCAEWQQKLCVFRSRPNLHRDRPRHCQWVSSLVRCLWLDWFVSVCRSAPRWRYGAIRLAPTQWRCGSNSTTAFEVYPNLCIQSHLMQCGNAESLV